MLADCWVCVLALARVLLAVSALHSRGWEGCSVSHSLLGDRLLHLAALGLEIWQDESWNHSAGLKLTQGLLSLAGERAKKWSSEAWLEGREDVDQAIESSKLMVWVAAL